MSVPVPSKALASTPARPTSLKLELAQEIIAHTEAKDDLFIPLYDEVFHQVLERYHTDFRAEGRHSYDYKVQSGRINKATQ